MRKTLGWTLIVAAIFGMVTIICRPSGPLFLLLPPLVFVAVLGWEILRDPPPPPAPRDTRVRVDNAALYRVGDEMHFESSCVVWEVVAVDRIEDEIYVRATDRKVTA